MSRYEVVGKEPRYRIVVGWDTTLQSFFGQVEDHEWEASSQEDLSRSCEEASIGDTPQEGLLVWIGTDTPILDVQEIIEALAPYGTIPDALVDQLRQDQMEGGPARPTLSFSMMRGASQEKSGPKWVEVVFAPLPEWSRLVLVYDRTVVDPLSDGLVMLSHLACIDSSVQIPLLYPLEDGQRRFGLVGLRADRCDGACEDFVNATWILALEWTGRAAWHAVLHTLQTLQPDHLSLPPDLLLPVLFLSHIADGFPTTAREEAERWAPLFAQAQTRLLPLLEGIYDLWMSGPSEAAACYRQLIGMPPCLQPSSATLLKLFVDAFGYEWIALATASEQLEARVLQILVWASNLLWRAPGATKDEQRKLLSPRFDPLFRGLLPIALWCRDNSEPSLAASGPCRTEEEILSAWKERRAGIG
jgi:hypothetical protein